jgi:hypothetical protein
MRFEGASSRESQRELQEPIRNSANQFVVVLKGWLDKCEDVCRADLLAIKPNFDDIHKDSG